MNNKMRYIILIPSLLLIFGVRVWAQSSYPNFHNKTSLVSFETSKQQGAEFSFTLAPDETSARPQWPVVFIDWMGNGTRQMINLTSEQTFKVKVPSDKRIVITGENGLWTVKAVDQSVTKATTKDASILRHLVLDKNLLGRLGSSGSDFRENRDLLTLSVAENYYDLLDVTLNTKLSKLVAASNKLKTIEVKDLQALKCLDLSKNLLQNVVLPNHAFDHIDLRVNRMKISTLPPLPAGTSPDKYYYTLQERFRLPRQKFMVGRDIVDLSSELKAKGIKDTEQTTIYEWYVEENAATDKYRKLEPGYDYVVKEGKTRFLRHIEGNLFVAMTTPAFPHLESFERVVDSDSYVFTKDGAEQIQKQPNNTTEAEFYTQVNDMVDNRTRKVYRSNLLEGICPNLWYGTKSNIWSDKENWTGKYVPKTLSSTPNDEIEEVRFHPQALRNLHVGEGEQRVVSDIVNYSETGKGVVVAPATSLRVKRMIKTDKVKQGNIAYHIYKDEVPAYRMFIESVPEKANGTLVFDNPEKNANVYASVEFYSKGYDGNFDKQHAGWQYFGTPVKGVPMNKIFPTSGLVRKFIQAKKDQYDEKWEAVDENEQLHPFYGYEITQPVPATYLFKGKLNLDTTPILTVAAPISGAPYGTFNAFANSYTASYDVKKIEFEQGLDKTVYIYSTGSRVQWLDHNKTLGEMAGQYIALPVNHAGTAGLPAEIASLQGFMVKLAPNNATRTASLKMPYSGVIKGNAKAILRSTQGKEVERSEETEYLLVDVASDRGVDRLYVMRNDGTTKGFDNGWDGTKIFSENRPQLFIFDRDNHELCYQVATSDDINETPVGFKADQTGSYTLTFDVSPALEKRYSSLYLKDLKTGSMISLANGGAYTFTASRGDMEHRFDIVIADPGLGTEIEPAIDVLSLGKQVRVDNKMPLPAKAFVYNANGVLVMSFSIPKQTVKDFSVAQEGMYVVKVFTDHVSVVKKVLLQ